MFNVRTNTCRIISVVAVINTVVPVVTVVCRNTRRRGSDPNTDTADGAGSLDDLMVKKTKLKVIRQV